LEKCVLISWDATTTTRELNQDLAIMVAVNYNPMIIF